MKPVRLATALTLSSGQVYVAEDIQARLHLPGRRIPST